MIVSVGDVKAARQQDLQSLCEFLGILCFELKLDIFMEYNRLSKDSSQKVLEFLKNCLKARIFV